VIDEQREQQDQIDAAHAINLISEPGEPAGHQGARASTVRRSRVDTRCEAGSYDTV
jgi:hypothetical protein